MLIFRANFRKRVQFRLFRGMLHEFLHVAFLLVTTILWKMELGIALILELGVVLLLKRKWTVIIPNTKLVQKRLLFLRPQWTNLIVIVWRLDVLSSRVFFRFLLDELLDSVEIIFKQIVFFLAHILEFWDRKRFRLKLVFVLLEEKVGGVEAMFLLIFNKQALISAF